MKLLRNRVAGGFFSPSPHTTRHAGPHRAVHRDDRAVAGQVSPDKDVNCDYAIAAFTVSPESRALSCCADLPGDSALYAVSVPRIRSGAGLAHSFALRLPSDGPSRFRPCSDSTCVNVFDIDRIHIQGEGVFRPMISGDIQPPMPAETVCPWKSYRKSS